MGNLKSFLYFLLISIEKFKKLCYTNFSKCFEVIHETFLKTV